jgi:hypothetical protein
MALYPYQQIKEDASSIAKGNKRIQVKRMGAGDSKESPFK